MRIANKSVRFFPWWNRYESSHLIGLIQMINDIFDIHPNISRMVEIGSHLGESTSIFLGFKKIQQIYCVDIWKNKHNENIFDQRLKNYIGNRCIKMKCSSKLACDKFDDNSIDMVYIDGNHQYKYVKDDLILWYNKLKPGGILSGHDYDESWKGCKRAIDDFILNNNYTIKSFIDCSWYLIKR